MKDSDGPSTNDVEPELATGGRCPSNGEIPVRNGSACRRRSSSGGGWHCGDVSGCELAVNGHLTAPRVALHQPPPPAADPGLAAAEHAGGGGGGGWTVPTRVQILGDVANLCTFAGAILATLAMACMWKGRYDTLQLVR